MTRSSDPELFELVSIARRAAALVRAIYATDFQVELKGPNDPVTRADREANELISKCLEQAFPGDLIVAEESVDALLGGADGAPWSGKERVFFVDPLDGTREFIDKNGEFAVMIGLAVRGRAELGAVVLPASGQAIYGRASMPGSAVIEDENGDVKPARVSSENDAACARLLVSRSHRPAFVDTVAARLGTSQLIPCGSVGVKVSRVATGAAELYVHGGGGAKLWDVCAPEAILHAARGRFSDLLGAPIDYKQRDLIARTGIIASNGQLHNEAQKAAAGLRF